MQHIFDDIYSLKVLVLLQNARVSQSQAIDKISSKIKEFKDVSSASKSQNPSDAEESQAAENQQNMTRDKKDRDNKEDKKDSKWGKGVDDVPDTIQLADGREIGRSTGKDIDDRRSPMDAGSDNPSLQDTQVDRSSSGRLEGRGERHDNFERIPRDKPQARDYDDRRSADNDGTFNRDYNSANDEDSMSQRRAAERGGFRDDIRDRVPEDRKDRE